MELEKALSIIKALAEGINPYTGEQYSSDSPYQTADTVRALSAAIIALEKQQKSIVRHKNLPKGAGKPWSEEEDIKLLDAYNNDVSIKELSKLHDRTEGAISSRLLKHGVINK